MVVSAVRDGDGTFAHPAVVAVGLISRLRNRLFGPTVRWECTDCGTVHKSNPPKCKNCGSTILRQHRDD